ncbi:hypothetical protein [Kitasatospora sp. MAP5-34]|uniref:hypothetical protein n=1 Tax=Kitasatospora sp. MAP5-34 TaxID=3035102 RepID=UPI002476D680|nr:hypothetical protein [Kitasatospora sp. MAP5-34]MDH6579751.1 hypothetical protein [Kitasatospora sp. MAP5-34]
MRGFRLQGAPAPPQAAGGHHSGGEHPAAVRLWLSQDPGRLAANLQVMHEGRNAALAVA